MRAWMDPGSAPAPAYLWRTHQSLNCARCQARDRVTSHSTVVLSRLGSARLGSAYIGLSKNRQAKPSQAVKTAGERLEPFPAVA